MNLTLDHGKKVGWIILILLPPVFLLYWIGQFAIDMPYLDEWDLVPTLQKSFEGALPLGNLFAQHNESRLLFPRLILIPLAHLTDWNINAEVAGIVFLAGLIFLLLAKQTARTCQQCVGRNHPWLPVIISFLIFSMMQYESWTFGFTFIGFMNIAAAIIGLMLLAQPGFSWPRFLGALLAGTVAVYSYSNGILFWIVGLLTLFAVLREERRQRLAPLWVWICWAAVLPALFYTGYQKPSCMPPIRFFIYHPDVFLGYFFAFLGGAIADTPSIPIWIPVTLGAIGCVLFSVTGLICLSREAPTSRALSFWVALGSYAVLGALAVAIGRSANGIPHALESRYTTLSNLFWISTLVMTVITLEYAGRAPALQSFRRYLIGIKATLVLFMVGCAWLFGVSSTTCLRLWQAKHDSLSAVRDELLCCAPDQSLLARSFPDPAKLKPRMEFLTRHRLSVFREKKSFAEYKAIPVKAGRIETTWRNAPPATGFQPNLFYATGRAYDPGLRQPARGVVFVNNQETVVARVRVDAAADFTSSSWKLALSAAKFPVGPVRLELYTVLQAGDLIASIGNLHLDIPPTIDPTTLAPISFSDPAPDSAGCTDQLRVAEDQVYGNGWARNPMTGQPGCWVIVTGEATNILAYAGVAEDRDDVARHFGNPGLVKSGWRIAFHQSRLSPGPHQLKAWLFLPEEHKALKLLNDFEVTIP